MVGRETRRLDRHSRRGARTLDGGAKALYASDRGLGLQDAAREGQGGSTRVHSIDGSNARGDPAAVQECDVAPSRVDGPVSRLTLRDISLETGEKLHVATGQTCVGNEPVRDLFRDRLYALSGECV